MFMREAGSAVPSANRITLLRDADGDGVAEIRSPYLTGLTSPFGMALVGDTLYVANADALVAFPYQAGATRIDAAPRTITALPADRNHHWTKSLAASPDGSRLYVGVGSNSNVAEHGMARGGGAGRGLGDRPRDRIAIGSTARACATRSGSPSSPGPATSMSSSTSATSSAATWCPII